MFYMETRQIIYRKFPDILTTYECLVSLAVHDAPEFLQAQLENINKYVSNCVIVIHVNSHTMELDENTLPENVWINPKWFKVQREFGGLDLLRGLVTNISHAYNICKFDRVLFLSSSCMFFRKISWDCIPKTAVCITPILPPDVKHHPNTIEELLGSQGWWWPRVASDANLVTWLRKNCGTVQNGQLSGTLLPEACIHLLFDLVSFNDDMPRNYSYDEIYAQTVGSYYAKLNNLPIYPALIQLHWYYVDGEKSYLCLTDFPFNTAKDDSSVYGLCKICHDIDGFAMKKLKELQNYFTYKDFDKFIEKWE